jgi:hypothetical protein
MLSWNRLAPFIVAAALMAPALGGCAEEQPAVNRVQPGALLKSEFLDSTFYLRQTVIDTPYSVAFTFVGEQGPLEKIQWEIQENYLIARRSYEFIANSEGTGLTGPSTARYAPVAIYAIKSHFDIRRQYNTTTGEELNVIEENTSDRPWYQRDHFRVDWSKNLAESADFLALGRLFDGVITESVAYEVPFGSTDPNAPKFIDQDGDERFDYMDIVNKTYVTPGNVNIEGLGNIPTCYLYYQDQFDCTSAEITVRSSFLKVDPERDYQPQIYTGDRMERFGYFVTVRAGYDPQYGLVESARNRFVNRHNVWQQSHVSAPGGGYVECTTDADCGGGRGSICDMDYARAHLQPKGACTIPYRDRAVRQIPYYLSSNFPEDLDNDAQHMAEEWDSAFIEMVGSAREQECLANGGGDATACAAARTMPDNQHVFVLCHSPVRAGEAEACGPTGTTVDIGDLRYSLIGWVNDPHRSSPLGYGPSAADPETGEIIQGNAFIYGAGIETLSTFARDIVALLNGDISNDVITSGSNVTAWVERMGAPGSVETGRPADDHVIPLDGADAVDVDHAMAFNDRLAPVLDASRSGPGTPRAFFDRVAEARARLGRSGVFGRNDNRGQARLGNLAGSDIERMLTTRDLVAGAGVDPSLTIDDSILATASPLRGNLSVARMRALDAARNRLQQNGCVLGTEFADEGMLGLAREIQRAVSSGTGIVSWYGHDYSVIDATGAIDQQAVRSMIRHPVFDAVTAHEVGHTLGLRHNFSGSFDSLNYNRKYWELRNADGTMRPRAYDPMTQAEIDGRIREYQYSTVMDYGNNFVVTDANGIGHYDRAAIKMGYADLVEVFSAVPAATQAEFTWYDVFSSYGWPVTLTWDAITGGPISAYTYTDLPGLVSAGGGIDGLEQRADVPYTSLVQDASLGAQGFDSKVVDAAGRPIVPYLFCSDEQADLGPDCLRYDAGADVYETMQNTIDTYWNYYVFNNFRRQRVGFNTEAYADRIQSRYFAKLQYANQIYALYRPIITDIFGDMPGFDTFFTSENGMGSWTLGVGAGYSLFTRVLAAPEPDTYAAGARPDGTTALLPGARTGTDIGVPDGRFMETSWNFDAGYFWFDQLERAGYFYDKVIALQTLTDPETHFLGRDTSADVREYQLSYYTTFAPSMTGLFSGLLSDNWATIGPRPGATAGAALVYPTALQLANGGATGNPIDPGASFSIQLYATILGMALIPQTFDQTYMNDARIYVQGGAERVTFDGPTVEFLDPATGLTYVAVSRLVGGVEKGVGAQMLLHAQTLSTRGQTVELARFMDNVNVVRRLSWEFGFGI